MDIDLKSIAIRGVFSAGRAARAGIDGTTLRQLVKAGECHPLHRGWYTPYRPKNARQHLRLRTIALLFEYGDVAVASHGSAIALLGLPTEGIDLSTAHLMWSRPSTRFEAFSRVRIHETVASECLPLQLEMVHPAVACLQVGLADPRALIVAADAAMRQEMVTVEQLREAADLLRGRRGLTRARAVIEWCDARHETPGESVAALVLRMLGFDIEPQFAPGLTGPGGGLLHADFRILGTQVLVEFDGKTKYEAHSQAQSREILFAEKRREDALREAGFEVVRLSWADLEDPVLVRRKIEAAIARSLNRAS